MKLENKKELVARSLGVGKGRIKFNTERLSELKEAITKQDIRDLKESGAIIILEKQGRKKLKKSKGRRRAGSVKKKVQNGKIKYITITRKLRAYLADLRKKQKLSSEEYLKLRQEIKASSFKSLSHLKERIVQMQEKE